MKRLTALFVLPGAGFVLSPATASAQFGFGYGYQRYGGPVVTPTFNPFSRRHSTDTSRRTG